MQIEHAKDKSSGITPICYKSKDSNNASLTGFIVTSAKSGSDDLDVALYSKKGVKLDNRTIRYCLINNNKIRIYYEL